MAWRCRFLTARPSQDGRVVAEKDFVKNCRVHPTHWLISTQLLTASTLFPATLASPDVGSTARQIIETVVVFPAPFAPSKPKTWPVGTPKAAHWTDSTAAPPKNLSLIHI